MRISDWSSDVCSSDLGLECDESLLTGESVPVRKRSALQGDAVAHEPGGDDLPCVFGGAIVTRGGGLACVTATGPRSRIGEIGRSLSSVETEAPRSEEHTSELQSLMRISYAVFCLKKQTSIACTTSILKHDKYQGK